jgi:hypothetical protein
MTRVELLADLIVRMFQSRGLTVVKLADTSFGSDAQDAMFALDVAAAADELLSTSEPQVRAFGWRPSDSGEVSQ